MSVENATLTEEKINYIKLFRFFLPLAITPVMIGLTHSIINAALARLPEPELSIAIFTVIRGLIMIISMPILMSLQMVVTFVDDMNSFQKTIKFIILLSFSLFFLLILLAYTPLGGVILASFYKLTDPQELSFAYPAMRIAVFLPLVQALRNTHQGLAISLKKTRYFIPGIICRLISISIFLWWVVKTQTFSGAIAGSLTWVAGIGIEGVFIALIILYSYQTPHNLMTDIPQKNNSKLTYRELFRFFLPLGLTMSFASFIQPIIQSGIARGNQVTLSLAAYGVAWSLVALISGALRTLHQLSLVFSRNVGDPRWVIVKRFSLITGLTVTILIILIGLTPFGYFLFNSIIGVSPEITLLARKVTLAFIIFPILRAMRESYWGLLMKRRTTSIIGIAKGTNMLAVFLILLWSITSLQLQPAILGALAFSIGELFETLVIWYYAIKRSL